MVIKKIKIENYKSIKEEIIELNDNCNIFIGENDSGKSTILEALSIVSSGKLNGFSFDKQLKTNMFNKEIRQKYIEDILNANLIEKLPEIVIEAYCDDSDSNYKGSNNSLGEDCPGFRVCVSFNEEYAKIYNQMIEKKQIHDIPIELYKIEYKSFKGETINYKFCPLSVSLIDAQKKDYSNMVDRFVFNSLSDQLDDNGKLDLTLAYRSIRGIFQDNESIKRLNENISKNVNITNKQIKLDLREEELDEWKKKMSLIVDDIPFENHGFGTQNVFKIELALENMLDTTNIILMEEPENSLSYTNMTKLISKINAKQGKQVFISTHSSFVMNKLGIENIFMVNRGKISKLKDISDDTINYFKKLPGYDTLRLVLAEKIILVEGPTDDLIVQRAYKDLYGVLPIENGIDIIVVDSLAFKRYCEITSLMNKKVIVVTDNDGNIQKNIEEKYKDFKNNDNVEILYEKDEKLDTIEPSVVEVNFSNEESQATFKKVISKTSSMINKTKEEIIAFMTNNKAEWALRVFEASEKIKYPEYINEAIRKFD